MNRPASSLPTDAQLGLGCNALGHIGSSEAGAIVSAALDGGVCVFDTAASYAAGGSERELGRCLPHDRSGIRIVSKFGHPGSNPEGLPCSAPSVRKAVELSLRNLQCDRLDCLVIHFPDPSTPLAETLGALDEMVRVGKIASYGMSNFSPAQAKDAITLAAAAGFCAPAVIQEEYSLVHRQKAEAILPIARERNIGFMPFFPLASGLVTDRGAARQDVSDLRRKIVRAFDDRFLDPDTIKRVNLVHAICARFGVPVLNLALRWLATRPGVGAIAAGASNSHQVRANLAAWHAPIDDGLARCLEVLGEGT